MSSTSQQEMHADHHRWSEDNAMWRDDLRAWEHETHEAEVSLGKIRSALKQHLVELQKHAAAVRLYEQSSQKHEHVMAQVAQGNADAAGSGHAPLHHDEAKHHADLKATHERIKQAHHQRLAALRTLLNTLSD
jgi:hypothetical protein